MDPEPRLIEMRTHRECCACLVLEGQDLNKCSLNAGHMCNEYGFRSVGEGGGGSGPVWTAVQYRDVPRGSSLTVPWRRTRGRATRWRRHGATWSPLGGGGGASPGAALSAVQCVSASLLASLTQGGGGRGGLRGAELTICDLPNGLSALPRAPKISFADPERPKKWGGGGKNGSQTFFTEYQAHVDVSRPLQSALGQAPK